MTEVKFGGMEHPTVKHSSIWIVLYIYHYKGYLNIGVAVVISRASPVDIVTTV